MNGLKKIIPIVVITFSISSCSTINSAIGSNITSTISSTIKMAVLKIKHTAVPPPPPLPVNGLSINDRNIMLEALTQRDWIAVNEAKIYSMYTFRVNNNGILMHYIEYDRSLNHAFAQEILDAPDPATVSANDPNSDSDPIKTYPMTGSNYKKSQEYYIYEYADGYKFEMGNSTSLMFRISEDKTMVLTKVSPSKQISYSLSPVVKIKEYDDGLL